MPLYIPETPMSFSCESDHTQRPCLLSRSWSRNSSLRSLLIVRDEDGQRNAFLLWLVFSKISSACEERSWKDPCEWYFASVISGFNSPGVTGKLFCLPLYITSTLLDYTFTANPIFYEDLSFIRWSYDAWSSFSKSKEYLLTIVKR